MTCEARESIFVMMLDIPVIQISLSYNIINVGWLGKLEQQII